MKPKRWRLYFKNHLLVPPLKGFQGRPFHLQVSQNPHCLFISTGKNVFKAAQNPFSTAEYRFVTIQSREDNE